DPLVKRIELGQIGFIAGDCWESDTLVALPLAGIADPGASEPRPMPAGTLITRPGTRIRAVAGAKVGSFSEIRLALREATRDALNAGAADATVPMTLELPGPGGETAQVDWKLGADDLKVL